MVDARRDDQPGARLGFRQGLGVGKPDLDVPVALEHQQRQIERCRDAGAVVIEALRAAGELCAL